MVPGEILTRIEFPIPAAGARHGFAELARRRDYAMTGVAMMTGPAPRMVWFALSDRPVRAVPPRRRWQRGQVLADVAALATEGSRFWGI